MSDATFEQGLPQAGQDGTRPAFWAQGRLGRNGVWLFLLSPLLAATVLATGALVLAGAFGVLAPSGIESAEARDWRKLPLDAALLGFAFTFLPFVLMLLGVLLATRIVHGRGPLSLMTAGPRFRWSQTAASCAMIFILALAVLGLTLLISPQSIDFVLDPLAFLLFLPLVLILVPLQVLAEEVLFRGYLLQVVGRFCSHPLALLLLPSGLFWAAHLGSDLTQQGGIWAILLYAVSALYLTYLALACDGLEHALGVHLGINLFAFLIEGVAGSWYPTPTVFLAREVDFRFSLLAMVAILAVHYWLVVRPDKAGATAARS